MDTPADAARLTRYGSVAPAQPGARWWMYERPRTNGVVKAPAESGPGDSESPGAAEEIPASVRPDILKSGMPPGTTAAFLVAVIVFATRVLHNDHVGPVLIPVVGVLTVVAFGRRCARRRPDEPWLPGLLLAGTVFKLAASYFRYLTLTKSYGGIGDATYYDEFGRKFVAFWTGNGPNPALANLKESNFLRWYTGVDYLFFGRSLVGAFLLVSLLAMIGSYFWYRAAADSVPFIDRRLFLIFMMFAPSIVFWPSSLGKEALLQVAVGGAAWATGLALNGRFLRALPLMLGSGWLMWIIRPHLLALVTVGAAIPYFLGRVRRSSKAARSLLARPLGMVAVAVFVVFSVNAGSKYLGLQTLSVDSLQQQLNAETERTAQGGSRFQHGTNSLSPLAIPKGIVTVLIRPFPWETSSGFQLLAALESVAVVALMVARFGSMQMAFRRARSEPFLLYCIVLLILYSVAFSSFANFGLLNRERSLVLPALYVLIAVDPARARRTGSSHANGELNTDANGNGYTNGNGNGEYGNRNGNGNGERHVAERSRPRG